MHPFEEWLNTVEELNHRQKIQEILTWIETEFPILEKKIAWKQPIFTAHGTFIIAFSVSKKHIAGAPEHAAIDHFQESFKQAGYETTKELFRIKWAQPIDYDLLKKIIQFNIEDKAEITTFWRPQS